jgi:hypothetical protein
MGPIRCGGEVGATDHRWRRLIIRVNNHERTTVLLPDDRDLVDLLTAVLVDPNLHTDRRMRLHRQVSAILRAAQDDLYEDARVYQDAPEGPDDQLPDLLTAVLVDPNLYTDLRMRLHREIRAVLGAATDAGTR